MLSWFGFAGAEGHGDGDRDHEAGFGLLRQGERSPKIVFRLVRELADDGIDVAVACRMLAVSRSGYYEWLGRDLCDRDLDDAYLGITIVDIHTRSRGSYGTPRTHAELWLGMGLRVV